MTRRFRLCFCIPNAGLTRLTLLMRIESTPDSSCGSARCLKLSPGVGTSPLSRHDTADCIIRRSVLDSTPSASLYECVRSILTVRASVPAGTVRPTSPSCGAAAPCFSSLTMTGDAVSNAPALSPFIVVLNSVVCGLGGTDICWSSTALPGCAVGKMVSALPLLRRRPWRTAKQAQSGSSNSSKNSIGAVSAALSSEAPPGLMLLADTSVPHELHVRPEHPGAHAWHPLNTGTTATRTESSE